MVLNPCIQKQIFKYTIHVQYVYLQYIIKNFLYTTTYSMKVATVGCRHCSVYCVVSKYSYLRNYTCLVCTTKGE